MGGLGLAGRFEVPADSHNKALLYFKQLALLNKEKEPIPCPGAGENYFIETL